MILLRAECVRVEVLVNIYFRNFSLLAYACKYEIIDNNMNSIKSGNHC